MMLREVSVDRAVREASPLLIQKKPSAQKKNFLSDLNKGRASIEMDEKPALMIVENSNEKSPGLLSSFRSPAVSPEPDYGDAKGPKEGALNYS